jgi:hypothetical protein
VVEQQAADPLQQQRDAKQYARAKRRRTKSRTAPRRVGFFIESSPPNPYETLSIGGAIAVATLLRR